MFVYQYPLRLNPPVSRYKKNIENYRLLHKSISEMPPSFDSYDFILKTLKGWPFVPLLKELFLLVQHDKAYLNNLLWTSTPE